MIHYTLTGFRRWHMAILTADGQPAGGLLMPDPETMRAMERAPNLLTLMADGLPVAAGGTLELWPNRHMAWALLPTVSGQHMLAITRHAYRLVRVPVGRVEMTVKRSFAAGHRWARMLGFEVETPVLKRYAPDGADFTGYVLFNGG